MASRTRRSASAASKSVASKEIAIRELAELANVSIEVISNDGDFDEIVDGEIIDDEENVENNVSQEQDVIITGYHAAKLWTLRLREMGIHRVIPGPRVYIYAAKKDTFNMGKAVKKTKKGVEKEVTNVDLETFLPWMEAECEKIAAKLAKVS